jgi:hypothetical protein
VYYIDICDNKYEEWGLGCNCQHEPEFFFLINIFFSRTAYYSFCILRQSAALITDCPNFNVSSLNGQSVIQVLKFLFMKYREYLDYGDLLTIIELLKPTKLNVWIISSFAYQWRFG